MDDKPKVRVELIIFPDKSSPSICILFVFSTLLLYSPQKRTTFPQGVNVPEQTENSSFSRNLEDRG